MHLFHKHFAKEFRAEEPNQYNISLRSIVHYQESMSVEESGLNEKQRATRMQVCRQEVFLCTRSDKHSRLRNHKDQFRGSNQKRRKGPGFQYKFVIMKAC